LPGKPASGDYRADNTAVARADLAGFLVKQVIDERYLKQAISVGS